MSHAPGIVTLLLLGYGLSGCAPETSSSEAPEVSQQALSVPDDALAKTLTPLRRLETPGAVTMEIVRETFPGAGVFPHTIHVYQPDGNGEAISFELTVTNPAGAIEWSHAFQTVVLTSHPGEVDETSVPLDNGAGQKTYTVATSTAGWYRLSFQYVAPNTNRTLSFRAIDAQGNALKIGWSDPSGANVQVRATLKVEQPAQAFFKGGAYRNASASEYATIDNVKVDNNLLYRRGFDQGPFNYPLGWLSAADHTLEFSFTASGNPSYLWFGVNERSFDGTGTKNEWAPVQFLYRGAMHTADYDAWKEGVAFAQGATLVPGVRPAPVRRGTAFGVAVEDTSLNGTWANASLRVHPLGSANPMAWTATQGTAGDYVGGIWTAGGFSSRNRETWTVQVPSDAPVGRYVLRAISPWGYQIGQDVLFYVIHNPYAILASGGISKQELETFGYDEDEDGVSLAGNVGSDADSARDNFVALYDSQGIGSGLYFARSLLTAAFRRTQADTSFSMLDMVMAASHGTSSEFDSMRRLYRLVAQRLRYSHFSLDDDASVTFMVDGSTFDPAAAAIFSQSGTANNTDATGGQCHDYGSILTALARAGGIVSRVISSTSGLGGWGLHYFTEAYIPDLPRQGGKTGPTGGAESDADHWYVFDATDPLGGGTELFWAYHSEAIAPRAEYGMASKITSPPSAHEWIVATTRLDWDPMYSGTVTPADLLSVADAYFSPGREYWLTSTPVTGFIGFSDKDVYRVSKEATGATGVRVSMLATADQTLVPALCIVSASDAAPQLPTMCPTPGQTAELPAGESFVVVFNSTPNPVVTLPEGGWEYSRILRGDVSAYRLEIVQGGSSCTDANSVDMGAPGTSVTVANNGCLKVTQYPSWWGTRKMQLQNMASGRYPTPFAVSNCNLSKGSGTITADWQSFYVNDISASCSTYVKLGGDGQGTVMVRYYAM